MSRMPWDTEAEGELVVGLSLGHDATQEVLCVLVHTLLVLHFQVGADVVALAELPGHLGRSSCRCCCGVDAGVGHPPMALAHAVGSPHHGHVDLGLLPEWRQWCSCIITESTGSCTSSTRACHMGRVS